MTRALILTSSRPPPQPFGRRPRTDFEVLAGLLGAEILLPGPGSAPLARLERTARWEVSQAVRAVRHRADVNVALSERIGMPLTALRPRGRTIVVGHLLTSTAKRLAAAATGLHGRATVLVYSRAQETYLRTTVGLPPAVARFVFDKVDADFFTPGIDRDPVADSPYVLAVGREARDYETLLAATRPLRIRTVLVPGSAWSHRSLRELGTGDGVELRSDLSYPELRELYRGAELVVVPVMAGTTYAAGVNSLLEAMACARPVVMSETPGIAGYVTDGVDGRLVRPGDADQLRAVIAELLADEDQATRIGAAGRATVERAMTVERFAATIAEIATAG